MCIYIYAREAQWSPSVSFLSIFLFVFLFVHIGIVGCVGWLGEREREVYGDTRSENRDVDF